MSKNFLKNYDFSSTKTVRPCENCNGTGSLVIHNAYDSKFREIEPCVHCGGTGMVAVAEAYGPN